MVSMTARWIATISGVAPSRVDALGCASGSSVATVTTTRVEINLAILDFFDFLKFWEVLDMLEILEDFGNFGEFCNSIKNCEKTHGKMFFWWFSGIFDLRFGFRAKNYVG